MNRIHKKNYPIILTAPALILFLVFYFFPIIQGIWYSFFNWNGFHAKWIGLENYIDLLTVPRLKLAFKNTFIFTFLTSTIKISLAFIIAIFLNGKLKTKNYLRTVFFSPVLLNNVAVAVIFTSLMHPTTGLLNRFLKIAGFDIFALNWLADPNIAIFSVCMIEIWKFTGFAMIIQLAGLQNISKEYYECAEIDGVTPIKKHLYITLPLMLPIINNNVFISLASGLKVFDIIMASTRGGPGYSTSVLNTVVYTSFGNGKYGESSAAQIMLGVLVTIVVLSTRKIISKYEQEALK